MTTPGLAARKAAADLLAGVLDRRVSLSEQLLSPHLPIAKLEQAERARAQSLATRTLRHLGRIDAFLENFLIRPPAKPAQNALRLAVTEIHIDGIAAHAAVDAAVNIARAYPKSRNLTGLVNAVLRRVARDSEQWNATAEQQPRNWLSDRLEQVYGQESAQGILAAHRTEPPLDLTPRAAAEARDLAAALGGSLLPTGSIRLQDPNQVSRLAGYDEGSWWVQDTAAALPVRLLGDVEGLRVLDLCAAPGGKTLQLAAAGAVVTALDSSGKRLKRLRENLERTDLSARIIAADARTWSPEQPFDAILLDAPCSASGTIRRHPDLPHVRLPGEIASLTELQANLLDRAWSWLSPGGRLVYCTCSLLPEEGEAQIDDFLRLQSGASCVAPDPAAIGIEPSWVDSGGGLRLRPDFWADAGGMDGFYAALLHKM